jgi:hypothetical protein
LRVSSMPFGERLRLFGFPRRIAPEHRQLRTLWDAARSRFVNLAE